MCYKPPLLLSVSSPPTRVNGLLFASVVLTVPSVEGGRTGTEGPQHAGSPIQTAGSIELLT